MESIQKYKVDSKIPNLSAHRNWQIFLYGESEQFLFQDGAGKLSSEAQAEIIQAIRQDHIKQCLLKSSDSGAIWQGGELYYYSLADKQIEIKPAKIGFSGPSHLALTFNFCLNHNDYGFRLWLDSFLDFPIKDYAELPQGNLYIRDAESLAKNPYRWGRIPIASPELINHMSQAHEGEQGKPRLIFKWELAPIDGDFEKVEMKIGKWQAGYELFKDEILNNLQIHPRGLAEWIRDLFGYDSPISSHNLNKLLVHPQQAVEYLLENNLAYLSEGNACINLNILNPEKPPADLGKQFIPAIRAYLER